VPKCGGDCPVRATRPLAVSMESLNLCPFGSGVYTCILKGECMYNLLKKPARPGREQRYFRPPMLRGCGEERKWRALPKHLV